MYPVLIHSQWPSYQCSNLMKTSLSYSSRRSGLLSFRKLGTYIWQRVSQSHSGNTRTRTLDRTVNSRLLYQLSYEPILKITLFILWTPYLSSLIPWVAIPLTWRVPRYGLSLPTAWEGELFEDIMYTHLQLPLLFLNDQAGNWTPISWATTRCNNHYTTRPNIY